MFRFKITQASTFVSPMYGRSTAAPQVRTIAPSRPVLAFLPNPNPIPKLEPIRITTQYLLTTPLIYDTLLNEHPPHFEHTPLRSPFLSTTSPYLFPGLPYLIHSKPLAHSSKNTRGCTPNRPNLELGVATHSVRCSVFFCYSGLPTNLPRRGPARSPLNLKQENYPS